MSHPAFAKSGAGVPGSAPLCSGTGAAGFSALLLCLSLSDVWSVTIAILVALGLFSIVFTATANSRL